MEARPLRSEKHVKTLLDLIQEFAALNEAKTLGKGSLPRAKENRWAELKRFYDMLMAQNGLAREPASPFTAAQIRERVAARGRLRVQTDLEIVVAQGPEYHRARVGNISRGGAMLHCDHPSARRERFPTRAASPGARTAAGTTPIAFGWGSSSGE
jgi:hypothetical protein